MATHGAISRAVGVRHLGVEDEKNAFVNAAAIGLLVGAPLDEHCEQTDALLHAHRAHAEVVVDMQDAQTPALEQELAQPRPLPSSRCLLSPDPWP